MFKVLYQSFMATVVIALIVCGIYPLAVTVLGQSLFATQANGSLILRADGKAIGSRLIGQVFTKPEYFHGRPSAAGTGYDGASSSGSNLGPTNQKFADALGANADAFLKENPSVRKGEIPNDLISASGSGLDPHISPDGAYAQVNRVAGARGLDAAQIKTLVQENIEGPQLGILGEPVVNVLELNLALEKMAKK